ncbi:MAG: SpoIIE family protein phosphatase [Leptonema sp. (in: Bacteria)]|nr:SpoIIE family protein phosphatase [Leptonema sp. (in: bacteria)]
MTINNTQALIEENRRLKSLAESFYLLSSSLDLQTVLRNTLNQATELMNAETGSIALINDEATHLVFVESTDKNFSLLKQLQVPIGQGIAGVVASTGKPERIDDITKDPRHYGKIDEELGHSTVSYICVPLIVNKAIIGTAQIMNRKDGGNFSEDDLSLLEGFAKQASLAIQNAKLHAIMLRQKAIESELSICSDIQRNLFPAEPPQIENYEIFGQSEPCREVGGDYYGYYERQQGKIDFVLADVSGKGLSAALLVSEFYSGLRMLDALSTDLASSLTIFNRHLSESILLGRFIGVFMLRLNPKTGVGEYILAGAPPPYLYGSDGSIIELETNGPVLGLSGTQYMATQIEIKPGDLLLAVSDGYTEAMNPSDELFGEERIKLLGQEWANAKTATNSEIAAEIDQQIAIHRNGRTANDDSTMMLIRRLK